MSAYLHNDYALEAIARQVICQYDPTLLHAPAPIPVESIMEKIYGLTIEFQYIRNDGRVLGETVFCDVMTAIYDYKGLGGYKLVPVKAGTVMVDASLVNNRNDGRYRYTCAHELAHWILHRDIYTFRETAAMTEVQKSSKADRIIERQADRLGSYLLMPKGPVKMAFYHNRAFKGDTTALLAKMFGVSRQAMGYRLEDMHLLL